MSEEADLRRSCGLTVLNMTAAAKAKEKAKYDLLYGAVPSRASSSAAKAAQVRDVMRANGLASSDLTSEEGKCLECSHTAGPITEICDQDNTLMRM